MATQTTPSKTVSSQLLTSLPPELYVTVQRVLMLILFPTRPQPRFKVLR